MVWLNMFMEKSEDKRKYNIGVTASAFDLCHIGHIRMLKECKQICKYLVVLLQSDPSVGPFEYRGKQKNIPILTVEERKEILEGIKYVDEIIVYNTERELYAMLSTMQADVRILGEDWKGKEYTGHDLGIPVHFNSRKHNYSTTALRNRIYEAEYKRRHS